MKGNNKDNIVKVLSDVTDALKYPTLTKGEQVGSAIGFWAVAGLFYLVVLAVDKEEKKCIKKIAGFHREMADKYKETVMTQKQYYAERREYCRAAT
jgi:hypothetical protein